MTFDEYVALRLLGARICVNCLNAIDIPDRDYHCIACLTAYPTLMRHACPEGEHCRETKIRAINGLHTAITGKKN